MQDNFLLEVYIFLSITMLEHHVFMYHWFQIVVHVQSIIGITEPHQSCGLDTQNMDIMDAFYSYASN